jgi:hypothetical protein
VRNALKHYRLAEILTKVDVEIVRCYGHGKRCLLGAGSDCDCHPAGLAKHRKNSMAERSSLGQVSGIERCVVRDRLQRVLLQHPHDRIEKAGGRGECLLFGHAVAGITDSVGGITDPPRDVVDDARALPSQL